MALTRRTGELTEESLLGALDAEQRAGRRPTLLVVGSAELELRAHRILGGGGAFAAMQTIVAHVELEESLGDAWELRAVGDE